MTIASLPELIAADTELAARQARYTENRRYYSGEHPIRRSRQTYRTERNYAALFVDTVAAHMGNARASFGDGPEADALEGFVAEALEAEDGELLDYDAETAASVDGDGCFKVTWDDQERRVRVARVDVSRVWARGRPDNPTEHETIAEQYELTDLDAPIMFGTDHAARIVASLGQRRKGTITEAWTARSWQVWLDRELMLEEPNPYGGILPYVLYPNWRKPGEAWGTGDIDRVKRLQDLANNASNDLDWVAALAGQVVVLEGAEAGNLTIKPGAVWELPEDAKAYVLDLLAGGALTQRLEYVRDVRDELFTIARIPRTALGDSTRDVSGFALQIQLGPLIRLVHRKRLNRTAALRRRARLIARLGQLFAGLPETALAPRVIWDDTIPSDRSDDLANAETELRLGRDLTAVLREIGVEDPEAELAARLQQIQGGLAAPVTAAQGATNGRTERNPSGV